jgi:hypothetical protein
MLIFDGSTWSFLHSSPTCESTEAKESESFKKMVDCCDFCRSRQQHTLLPQLNKSSSNSIHPRRTLLPRSSLRLLHAAVTMVSLDLIPLLFYFHIFFAPMLTGRKPLKCFNSFDCCFSFICIFSYE